MHTIDAGIQGTGRQISSLPYQSHLDQSKNVKYITVFCPMYSVLAGNVFDNFSYRRNLLKRVEMYCIQDKQEKYNSVKHAMKGR